MLCIGTVLEALQGFLAFDDIVELIPGGLQGALKGCVLQDYNLHQTTLPMKDKIERYICKLVQIDRRIKIQIRLSL